MEKKLVVWWASFALLVSLSLCAGGLDFSQPTDSLHLADLMCPSEAIRRWGEQEQETLGELFALRGVIAPNPCWKPANDALRRCTELARGVAEHNTMPWGDTLRSAFGPERLAEGDAFEHTMQVLDAAASQTYADFDERCFFLYVALCHDLGKAVCDGYGHAAQGVPCARALLRRIGMPKQLCKRICQMVRHHAAPEQIARREVGLLRAIGDCAATVSPGARWDAGYEFGGCRREVQAVTRADCKTLADSLGEGVTVADLLRFAHFDFCGCSATGEPLSDETFLELELFALRARQAGVLD